MQVYKYYKDLISFKSIGDPRIMLKCINPREVGFNVFITILFSVTGFLGQGFYEIPRVITILLSRSPLAVLPCIVSKWFDTATLYI